MYEPGVGVRLVLGDGTVYEEATAGYTEGTIVLFMRQSITLQDAASVFFNPAKTSSIRFEYGEMADTYEGFTKVINLMEDVDGNVTVILKRGDA